MKGKLFSANLTCRFWERHLSCDSWVLLATMHAACMGQQRRCLLLQQRVSHSSWPRAVMTSWWDLAPKKQENKPTLNRIPPSRTLKRPIEERREECIFAAPNPDFEKCTPSTGAQCFWAEIFRRLLLNRKNGEDASARSAQVCVWQMLYSQFADLAARRWKMRGKSAHVRRLYLAHALWETDIATATLWRRWRSVHHQLCSICLNKWICGNEVSNHSGFPTWFLRLHRPRQRFKFWRRLLQFQLAWLIPADLADSFWPW